ncbi:MAG: hypothetical protein CM15mP84_08550 [Cellvibrionales bacterium]|nr:MAG: hypothetical protein CM15mP84_08550 [Cellvibrionales bacterium]
MKDEAKRTALKAGVSVTPGIDNGTTLTLLKKYPDEAALAALSQSMSWMWRRSLPTTRAWRHLQKPY